MSIIRELKASFENAVLNRDSYKCVSCESQSNLFVHLISSSKDGLTNYVPANGITLCSIHLEKAKQNNNEFHQDDLYVLINSSYELFINQSKALPPHCHEVEQIKYDTSFKK